jgi:hypothetical protein
LITMKKNLILLCLMIISALAYSQVGISTPNPQGVLHVDGAKDNPNTGSPNAAQQANDFIVTPSGNVGLGTTTPTVKLELNNGTTNGAIKIVDGTQGAGRVLTSDASGVATWSPTPATSLYFLSSSAFTGTTDFTGTSAPVIGAPSGGAFRYLATGIITNLGPTTTITSGTAGLSYRIPVTGIYRITLYTDRVPTNVTMTVAAYRSGSAVVANADVGNGASSLVMIDIWSLQAGDIVTTFSRDVIPSGSQAVETTFTIERVN